MRSGGLPWLKRGLEGGLDLLGGRELHLRLGGEVLLVDLGGVLGVLLAEAPSNRTNSICAVSLTPSGFFAVFLPALALPWPSPPPLAHADRKLIAGTDTRPSAADRLIRRGGRRPPRGSRRKWIPCASPRLLQDSGGEPDPPRHRGGPSWVVQKVLRASSTGIAGITRKRTRFCTSNHLSGSPPRPRGTGRTASRTPTGIVHFRQGGARSNARFPVGLFRVETSRKYEPHAASWTEISVTSCPNAALNTLDIAGHLTPYWSLRRK